jgi:hypothetical protein
MPGESLKKMALRERSLKAIFVMLWCNSVGHAPNGRAMSANRYGYSSPLPSFLRRDAAAAESAARPVPKRTTVIGSGMVTGAGGAGGSGVTVGVAVGASGSVVGVSVGVAVGSGVGGSVVGTSVGGSVGCGDGVSAAGTPSCANTLTG